MRPDAKEWGHVLGSRPKTPEHRAKIAEGVRAAIARRKRIEELQAELERLRRAS